MDAVEQRATSPEAAPPPVSAIVVYHSEEEHVEACLESLGFADELMLVNVNEDNDPERLSDWLDVEVLDLPGTDVVEETRRQVVDRAENDWLVFLDPDERMSSELAEDLLAAIAAHPEAAAIRVPWRFYFRGEVLRTTEWGRPDHTKPVAVHRDRVEFRPHVHRGFRIEGPTVVLDDREGAVLHHHWCDSYEEFMEKHRRYIEEEGRARYENGQRFSVTEMAYRSLRSLGKNLLYHRGLLGGPDGIALSFLRAWYEARSWWNLRDHERRPEGSSEADEDGVP